MEDIPLGVRQRHYDSHGEYKDSDHRAVSASFQVKVGHAPNRLLNNNNIRIQCCQPSGQIPETSRILGWNIFLINDLADPGFLDRVRGRQGIVIRARVDYTSIMVNRNCTVIRS